MSVSLQFLHTLSEEAQSAYQISQYMLNNPGTSIGKAAFQLSKGTWDAARLTNGLSKVTTALAEVGGTTGDYAAVEQVVQHGLEAAKTADTAAKLAAAANAGRVSRVLGAVGRWVLRLIGKEAVEGSALALGVGVATTVAVLAGATYLGSNYLGGKFGDSPILPGARFNQPPSTAVTVPQDSTGLYAIYELPNNSGGGTWVIDTEADLKGKRGCDTPNGGMCDDPNQTYPPVVYVKVSADFASYDEAHTDFCANITVSHGFWGDKGQGFGYTSWMTDSCP